MSVAIDSTLNYLNDNYLAKFNDFPLSIKNVVTENNSLMLYPNPNTGSFTITGTSLSKDKTAAIEITDMLGKLVQTGKANINGGNIRQELVLDNNIATGVYFLRLRTSAEEQSVRFIKK